MTIESKHITGIILAGGKSSRMGTDKGLMLYKGKAFVSHIIEALQTLVSEIIIVSQNPLYDQFNLLDNRDLKYSKACLEMKDHFHLKNPVSFHQGSLYRVEDMIPDAGPLAGLYTGLYHSKTEHNIVLSCDIPLIKSTILQQYIINHITEDVDVVQIESHGKTMPLIASYKKHCMHQCLTLLNKGERRLRIAVQQFKTKTISIESSLDKYISNINTSEEFKTINTTY